MRQAKDLTGMKFGRLTLESRGVNDMYGRIRYNCRCDCGVTGLIAVANIKNGNTKSCGCLRLEMLSKKRGAK